MKSQQATQGGSPEPEVGNRNPREKIEIHQHLPDAVASKVGASTEQDEKDKEKAAAEKAQVTRLETEKTHNRISPWLYVISEWDNKRFIKSKEDFIKKEDDENKTES